MPQVNPNFAIRTPRAGSRTVVITGAGIGGLTLALALARRGFRAVIFEQADRLDETGAGIQLSPNATRVLIALGLRERLERLVVAPDALRIVRGPNAKEIVRVPLGPAATFRFGSPYWVIHRGDLQAVLVEAVRATPDVVLRLGARVEDFAVHAHGVTVQVRQGAAMTDDHGIALVGADGLWSTLRKKLGDLEPPRFGRRTAWRAVVPAEQVAPEHRARVTTLWLGADAHLVHYPVKAGDWINVVAIVKDVWKKPGWSAEGAPGELMARFARWAPAARSLLAVPQSWLKWALYDRPPTTMWGKGPATLLGDAAHPMLPFLAQGGAMAIEDAAVLARSLHEQADPSVALRSYEGLRQDRTARVRNEAWRNGKVYHLAGPAAFARNAVLTAMGGERLLAHYDWLYDWRNG